MFITNFLLALAVALFFTVIFGIRYRRTGPWMRIEAFFVVLFLATWGIGLWIIPFGPVIFGVSWMPFFLAGLIIGLFLAAASSRPPKTPKEALTKAFEQAGVERSIDIFFWFLVMMFILAIAGRYLWPGYM